MKDIKIHIHDFGPLHEVEFQLAPMMIFTGMSNLGKSYANYVAYYTISSIAGDILERIISSKYDKDAENTCGIASDYLAYSKILLKGNPTEEEKKLAEEVEKWSEKILMTEK